MTEQMENKVVVVTGATSGIGFAAAKELAKRGAVIIGVGRSAERNQKATSEILAETPRAKVTYLLADLSSQGQVRKLGREISEWVTEQGFGKLDVLVNNAGMVTNWYTATEDGYETTFAVNHLAPFLLTHELTPLLKTAPAARVVTVSSFSHRKTRMHWRDIMMRHRFNTLFAYQQSKLGNVFFSTEFNRRFGKTTAMRAYAIDPGLVNTDIGLKGTGGIVNWFWGRRQKKGVTPEKGAETVVFVSADPALEGSLDVYWKDCAPQEPSKYSQREEEANRLWELSERLCGISGWGVHSA
jgi:retinol dehydrogenase 12